jgi:hypothetical protein
LNDDDIHDDESVAARSYDTDDIDDDVQSTKAASRDIPNWGEVVGMIISGNMEARARSPRGGGGGQFGGRRSGGQGHGRSRERDGGRRSEGGGHRSSGGSSDLNELPPTKSEAANSEPASNPSSSVVSPLPSTGPTSTGPANTAPSNHGSSGHVSRPPEPPRETPFGGEAAPS